MIVTSLSINTQTRSRTEEVEAADGDHQVEVGTVEAATGGPRQPQHHGEAEEAVEAGAEAAAEAGARGEQGDHRSVSGYCVPRNLVDTFNIGCIYYSYLVSCI